jgi:mono/diheme cytochrome c family protein
VGALVALIAIAAGTVFAVSNGKFKKTYAVTPRPVAVPSDAATVARGRHIAQTRGCVDCHGADLGGAMMMENGAMGRVHGSNLTRGTGGRVVAYKEEDWVKAIRHGVRPDGRGIYFMPSAEFCNFSDADLGALIAFLKTVPPVDRENGPIAPGPVVRVLLALGKMKFAAEEIDHANLHPPAVAPTDTVEYGRYLAAGCTGCHRANFSGGKIELGPPDWPEAANLTSHPGTGMSKWSEADFVRTLRTAKRPDGTELNTAMPRAFGQMDDGELRALYAFLKTLPATAKGTP